MLDAEGVSHVLSGIKNIKEALKVYYKFYKPEQEKKFGVLAIKIKKNK